MAESFTENTETVASIQVEGYEMIEKIVKASGNSGRVYLPAQWVGCKVKVVRVSEVKMTKSKR